MGSSLQAGILKYLEFKHGMRVYKLHGSITWWRTEEGDYKSIPIIHANQVITLSSGKPAIPLIVYPGKKLEYNDTQKCVQ